MHSHCVHNPHPVLPHLPLPQPLQWDTYGHQIEPVTSRIPTMYTMGNHEYDDPNAYDSRFSTSVDSGERLWHMFCSGNSLHAQTQQCGAWNR